MPFGSFRDNWEPYMFPIIPNTHKKIQHTLRNQLNVVGGKFAPGCIKRPWCTRHLNRNIPNDVIQPNG